MIFRELSDPNNPQSEPTYIRYRVYSSSKGIKSFLEDLRETGEEIKSGKGKGNFRYVLDTDMD